QIAPANARSGNANDSISRLDDFRVRHVLDPDIASAIHHSCAHNSWSKTCYHSDFSEAMSIEKRYFTSDLSNLSYASLTFWMGITSTSVAMLCLPQKSSIS